MFSAGCSRRCRRGSFQALLARAYSACAAGHTGRGRWKNSCALLLAAVLSASSVDAAQIEYKTNSDGSVSIEGNVSISRIAERNLSHGNVSVHDSIVELTDVGNDYSYSAVLLSGKIVKCAVTTQGGAVTIDGMIYFDGGTWLRDIDDTRAIEFAFYEGGFLRGRITAITKAAVAMDSAGRREEIKLRDLIDMRSPRIYNFSIRNKSEMVARASMPLNRLAPLSINPHKKNADDPLSELMDDPDLEGLSIFRPANPLPQTIRHSWGAAGFEP